ncbi:hypothetical protein [Asaia sp. HN010]|uniref:hypothetical protein n=1 Tax=Asaia sp. HN010 TaxID=3081233 RepID=UPI0030175A12
MNLLARMPLAASVGIIAATTILTGSALFSSTAYLYRVVIDREAHENERIAEMVKSGASPIEAACAIGRINHDAPVCVMSLMSTTPVGGPLPETLAPDGDHPGDPT